VESPLALAAYGNGDLLFSNYEHFVSVNPYGYNITPSIVELDPTTKNETIISSGGLLNTPQSILVVVPEPTAFAAGASTLLAGLMLRRRRQSRNTWLLKILGLLLRALIVERFSTSEVYPSSGCCFLRRDYRFRIRLRVHKLRTQLPTGVGRAEKHLLGPLNTFEHP
jgi:hypothetical protein